MRTSAIKVDATAVDVTVTDERLTVILADGRELSAPLTWFPRLLEAAEAQRQKWRFFRRGKGIHCPEIDEDVSIVTLLRAPFSILLVPFPVFTPTPPFPNSSVTSH